MSLLKSLFCLVLVSLALTGCNTADKKMENIADQAATAGTGTDATTSGYSNGAG
jgi:Flp pilus assembly protein TadG